jgi:octaprenyl-diphosphate synthase
MLTVEVKSGAAPKSASPEPAPAAPWKRIVAPVEPFLEAVSARLGEQVRSFDPEIARFAQYALSSQGKQLRPALVGLSANAAGKLTDEHTTVAVIIEMIHLATLVHDDIMDEARIRRQRPTLAANWGNQISVLLGDCLFAHALRLASGFPTTEVCRVVSSATKTVCSGEILQTNRRHDFGLTRADYFKIIAMKTAELFALSCDLGGCLGGATAARRAALREFGMQLGVAYQIHDDCLDLYGSEKSAGKSLGTDLASGKLTLPVLVFLERAKPAEQARIKDLISTWRPEFHDRTIELLETCDALAACRATIHQTLDRACASLAALPESPGRDALAGLTHLLAAQTDSLGTAS